MSKILNQIVSDYRKKYDCSIHTRKFDFPKETGIQLETSWRKSLAHIFYKCEENKKGFSYTLSFSDLYHPNTDYKEKGTYFSENEILKYSRTYLKSPFDDEYLKENVINYYKEDELKMQKKEIKDLKTGEEKKYLNYYSRSGLRKQYEASEENFEEKLDPKDRALFEYYCR